MNTSHPYYPRDLILPHYIQNDKGVAEILAVFFGIVVGLITFTWFYSGRQTTCRRFTILDRFKLCWFVTCGMIHMVVEGYFSLFHATLAGEQSILAQLWKEYSKGDSRYVSSDNFTVCMESITAAVDGPLCLLATVAFFRNSSYRYLLQLIVSLCQLYGDTLYLLTEYRDSFSHSEKWHPLYFWFYFVFLNMLWIVIPLLLIMQAVVKLSWTQVISDGLQKSSQHNTTNKNRTKKIG